MREVSSSKPSRRRLRVRCIAGLTFAIACFSCQEAPPKPRSQRADSISSSASATPEQGPLTASGLARTLSALKERAGKAPSMLVVELLAERAVFQVQSVAPGKLEQYEWRENQLTGPFSVEVRGNGVLEQNLFSFSSVDWTSIPELSNAARSQIDSENGQVTKVLVRRNFPQDEAVVIRLYVDSPVRSGHVDADGRGKFLDTPRSPSSPAL